MSRLGDDKMKVSKAITEIYKEIDIVQLNLDKRDNNNQFKIMELIGKKDGLALALEIIKNNI